MHSGNYFILYLLNSESSNNRNGKIFNTVVFFAVLKKILSIVAFSKWTRQTPKYHRPPGLESELSNEILHDPVLKVTLQS